MPSKLYPTRLLPIQNEYTIGLLETYRHHAVDEERAPALKGLWRQEIFGKFSSELPIDLEIGVGNGWFFKHHLQNHPDRLMLGLELKYKPLIQTIRSCLNEGLNRGAVIRYNAFDLLDLFNPGDLSDVYMHFPDPWTSPRKPKNRLPSLKMLEILEVLQKPECRFIFKTDSVDLFDWALEEFGRSRYRVVDINRDYWKAKDPRDFCTQFESYFLRQKLPIYFCELQRPAI